MRVSDCGYSIFDLSILLSSCIIILVARICFARIKLKKTLEEKFWKRIHKTNDCWIWQGGKIIRHNEKLYSFRQLAHKYIFNEEDSKPLYNTCGNSLCVRHLTRERPKPTPEARQKIAAWHTGRASSESTRQKIRESRLGKTASAESRAKMSASQMGKKKPWTPERRERFSEIMRAYYKNPEHRKRLAHNKGRKLDEQWRKNCSRTGKQNGRYGKSPPLSSSRGKRVWYKGICFRSSYEARVAQAFDKLNWQWEYEPERFELYGETYLVDFRVNGTLYAEVKGWVNDDARRKVSAFRELYSYPLVVLTLPEIKQLEAGITDSFIENAIND